MLPCNSQTMPSQVCGILHAGQVMYNFLLVLSACSPADSFSAPLLDRNFVGTGTWLSAIYAPM